MKNKDYIQVGNKIGLNTKNVKKYLESNEGQRLDGDSMRNLSIRKDCHNFFLRGYFDNDTVLVAIISLESDEDGGKYEWSSQFIPTSCIKDLKSKLSIPDKLKEEIKLFEGLQSYEGYMEERNKRRKELDSFFCEIDKADSRFSKFLEGVLIGARSIISNEKEKVLKIPVNYLYITGGLAIIHDLLENKNPFKDKDTYSEEYKNYQSYILSLKHKHFLKDIFISGTFKKNNDDSKGFDYLELVIKNEALIQNNQ